METWLGLRDQGAIIETPVKIIITTSYLFDRVANGLY